MKKVFLGLTLVTTLMSFTNINAETEDVISEFGECCTVSGGGVTVKDCNPGDNCGRAYRTWASAMD